MNWKLWIWWLAWPVVIVWVFLLSVTVIVGMVLAAVECERGADWLVLRMINAMDWWWDLKRGQA